MVKSLLARAAFRESCLERDNYSCVVCKNTENVVAHHIVERRLFSDGGYYLNNGATLCHDCHYKAEGTTLSCSDIRKACGITEIILPPHLYRDQEYDKWGNPVLPNGTRLRGELFDDESVQKVLKQANVLNLFTNLVKYPRTYHLPWSPGLTSDDRQMENTDFFKDKEVVVTIKMDGEQTTMNNKYVHARSLEYEPHPSRNYVKTLHGKVGWNIPEGWRVCGENLFAKHSIKYENLEDYFQVFSIWDESNICLSWDDTKVWAELLELTTVLVLFRGIYNEELIKELHKDYYNNDPCEGYVVRLAGSFHYSKFKDAVGKYVRKNHVHTHGHWMRNQVEPNILK